MEKDKKEKKPEQRKTGIFTLSDLAEASPVKAQQRPSSYAAIGQMGVSGGRDAPKPENNNEIGDIEAGENVSIGQHASGPNAQNKAGNVNAGDDSSMEQKAGHDGRNKVGNVNVGNKFRLNQSSGSHVPAAPNPPQQPPPLASQTPPQPKPAEESGGFHP